MYTISLSFGIPLTDVYEGRSFFIDLSEKPNTAFFMPDRPSFTENPKQLFHKYLQKIDGGKTKEEIDIVMFGDSAILAKCLLTIPESVITIWGRSSQLAVITPSLLEPKPEWFDRLKVFCKKHSIPYQKPQWYLSSHDDR